MSLPSIPGNPRSMTDRDYQEIVMSFLRYGWPPKLTDTIRVVKFKKGYTGALFDLWEDRVEVFMEYYRDLQAKG